MSSFYAALEIGTTRTLMAIAEADPGKRLRFTCYAEIPSSGIRKSQILNIPDATQSIRSVLREIEKKQDALGSKVSIGNAYLVVSGQHVYSTHVQGQAIIAGRKVTAADMEKAQSNAREFQLGDRRELLDFIDQDFVLDGSGGLSDPKGMTGKELKVNMLQIHADANRISDARNAADAAHLEIYEPVFAATCAADAVLEAYERKNGALVLDLGGGSTGYAAYLNNTLVATGVIGVGGDHITSDISHAFQTSNAQAETLKCSEASAEIGPYTPDRTRAPIVGSSALMESRTISRHALDTVVNARVKEIFSIIRERLEEQGVFLHQLHGGCVLTGGGAKLKNIDSLAQKELGLNVRLGRPHQLEGTENGQLDCSYAAIVGALMYAHKNSEPTNFVSDLFRRFFK